MEYVLKDRIKLGVSACNFGARVRWNGAGWDRLSALGREKSDFIWTPVCPEIFAGFGVPRNRMRLVSGNGDDFWKRRARVKNSQGRDVSEETAAGARVALDIAKKADVEGFVFMEGSPSCGVYRTTLKGARAGKPPGAFGSLLLQEDLFLIPALDIESPWKWWDWSRRLYAFAWLKRQPLKNRSSLYEAWHSMKFLCQEADEQEARGIGRMIADGRGRLTDEYVSGFKKRVLELLRKPSTLKKINGAMVKHYAHYRRQFGLKAEELSVPDSERGKKQFVNELRALEKKAFDSGYLFAGSPVAYRPGR